MVRALAKTRLKFWSVYWWVWFSCGEGEKKRLEMTYFDRVGRLVICCHSSACLQGV